MTYICGAFMFQDSAASSSSTEMRHGASYTMERYIDCSLPGIRSLILPPQSRAQGGLLCPTTWWPSALSILLIGIEALEANTSATRAQAEAREKTTPQHSLCDPQPRNGVEVQYSPSTPEHIWQAYVTYLNLTF